jgi:hypothetical protein
MPRLFNRVISFRVEGEIYDTDTTPEQIIKSYDWSFKHDGGNSIFCSASYDDNRGRITNMTRLNKIQKWRKPDTEYFII